MFSLFSHPAFHSGIPANRCSYPQYQHQPQARHPFDMFFNPHANSVLDDEDDSEEQYLRTALERKQQQRFARQHYLRQQQELAAKQRVEQERAILEQQRRARASAQAKYEAEQEAMRQYRLKQKQLKEQQRAQMQQQRKQELEAACLQQQEEDPLTELISSIFLPFFRPQATEQATSESKVKSNDAETEPEVEKDKEPADQEVGQEQDPPEEDLVGDYYAANPEIKSLVENLLGTHIESREIETLAEASEEALRDDAAADIPIEVAEALEPTQSAAESLITPDSAPSSVPSPELRAADILKQREQRHLSADKHAQLDNVESTLNNLSSELHQIVTGTITTKNQILATEENLIKAMFKIDAVENAGDSVIRHRRKELIERSQELLELVDAFKGRKIEHKEVANVAETVSDSVEPELVQQVHEVEEQDTAIDIDELSDVESLPDIESVLEAQDAPNDPEDGSSLKSTNESDQERTRGPEWIEPNVVDPLDHILGSVFTLARSALGNQDSILRDLDAIFA